VGIVKFRYVVHITLLKFRIIYFDQYNTINIHIRNICTIHADVFVVILWMSRFRFRSGNEKLGGLSYNIEHFHNHNLERCWLMTSLSDITIPTGAILRIEAM